MYLPTSRDYTPETLIHELIHSGQDSIGILDKTLCGSENEFQTFALTNILVRKKGEDSPFPGNENNAEWGNYAEEIMSHIYIEDELIKYDPVLIDKLSKKNLVTFRENFLSFCKSNDKGKNIQNTTIKIPSPTMIINGNSSSHL